MAFETEYDAIWGEMYKKRLDLFDERARLEAELSDVNKQIVHMNEIMSHLGTLAGVPPNEDIASMGITDAVRWTLNNSGELMSANDVRDKLTEKGYDLSSLTAPMASIYKILHRLSSEPKPEITRKKDQVDGKVYYQWIKKEDDPPF